MAAIIALSIPAALVIYRAIRPTLVAARIV